MQWLLSSFDWPLIPFLRNYQLWLIFTGFYRVLPSFPRFYCVIPGFYRVSANFIQVFPGAITVTEIIIFHWFLPGFTEFQRISSKYFQVQWLLSNFFIDPGYRFLRNYQLSLIFTGFYQVLPNFIEVFPGTIIAIWFWSTTGTVSPRLLTIIEFSCVFPSSIQVFLGTINAIEFWSASGTVFTEIKRISPAFS